MAETTRKPIGTNISHHFLQVCRYNVVHLEKVFSNVREKLGRQLGDDVSVINVNTMSWEILMSATVKAAVHIGQNYQENVRTTKNTDFDKVEQLFDICHKLILIHCNEMFRILAIAWNTHAHFKHM